jgi:hypothetical protein
MRSGAFYLTEVVTSRVVAVRQGFELTTTRRPRWVPTHARRDEDADGEFGYAGAGCAAGTQSLSNASVRARAIDSAV